MVKIEKQVEISISGEDFETLSAITELARRHIDQHKKTIAPGEYTVDEFGVTWTYKIQELMGKIFEA